MGTVLPFLGGQPDRLSPYDDFVAARKAMIRAYLTYLKTRPDAAVVTQEIGTLTSVMVQLRMIELPDA